MAEYIDRECLYKFLCEQTESITGAYSRGRNDGLNIAKSAVHNLQIIPAADVAPVVHGRWIEEDGYQVCSNCGEEHCWDEYRASFCDCCGAKMD